MNSITFNIPAHLVSKYRGRQVVVRSSDPTEIAQQFVDSDWGDVKYVQLLSADCDPETLSAIATAPISLDVVMSDPDREYPLLYNFAKLRDRHAVRVTISVRPGFLKAVKLAASLHFAVKLEVGQPDETQIAELAEVLELYLHRSGISQPIEFFHTLFLSSFNGSSVSLWDVQEEDPDYFCFVSDNGRETISPRFAGVEPVNAVGERVGNEGRQESTLECYTCEFFSTCRGYFKWPDSGYDCAGVKSLFKTIESAAAQLNQDVKAAAASGGPQI